VLALAIGVWIATHPAKPAPTPPAVQQARLGINAFPWANVTGIRNLDNGKNVDLASPLVTPVPIDLAPGRYEVTLSNPNFAAPITKTVALRSDQTINVQFTDPANATLPDFGGGK